MLREFFTEWARSAISPHGHARRNLPHRDHLRERAVRDWFLLRFVEFHSKDAVHFLQGERGILVRMVLLLNGVRRHTPRI